MAEQKAAEREAKRLHEEARLAEVASLNAQLAETYDEIDSILSSTLEVDDFVDLEQLRVMAEHPPFARTDLEVPTPLPTPISAPPEPVLALPRGAKGPRRSVRWQEEARGGSGRCNSGLRSRAPGPGRPRLPRSLPGNCSRYKTGMPLSNSGWPGSSRSEASTAANVTPRRLVAPHPTGDGRITLSGQPGADVAVSAEALRLLAEILGHLARGEAVTVAALAAEITTQQAAELLNVSRPFVVKLLDDGQVPFRKVGNRRRMRLADVLAYRQRDDEHRELVLRRLTEESEALGLYE